MNEPQLHHAEPEPRTQQRHNKATLTAICSKCQATKLVAFSGGEMLGVDGWTIREVAEGIRKWFCPQCK